MGQAMTSQHSALPEVFVQQGKLSEKDKNRILNLQRKSGKSFVHLLYEEKILEEHEIVRILSRALNCPVFHLDAYQLDPDILQLMPQRIMEQYEAVPVARIGSVLTLAISRPVDLLALDDLERLTGCHILPVLSRNESVTLLIVKPFHRAFCHSDFPFYCIVVDR
jgi:type IV pilus assembly protein PilB